MSGDVIHRLGMTGGVLLALAWAVRRLVMVRRRRTRHRVVRLLGRGAPVPRARFEVPGAARRWLLPTGAACGVWALVGGVTGVLLGFGAGAVLWRWRDHQSAAGRPEEIDTAKAARQLPLAADLLAACISAGAGPVIAAQAVGEAIGGPVGQALAQGAAEVRLGGEPARAWRLLASLPGAGGLAQLLERADESGVPAAGPVARLASDARAEWTRAATARARRAAVLISAPVGLCFLPAFIAVGVLPVVIGLAGGAMGGG
ncbi:MULTISPECIES: type II secretion system F family protein [Streptomyces]|uniref:type II secretion system F family protein n=1 Tax=Streptomyces TaxID=1883 RepID=UPI000A66D91E|nr:MULTISPECIES: type II secretion system F family protein [Streptomyces]